MGLLDMITGGSNQNAQDALAQALANIQRVHTPTAEEMKLSPLSQYYSTGELDPALMQAAQQGQSAFDNENLSSVPMSTMQQVLAKQGEIANAQGMTPQEQAAIANAIEQVNTNTAGQRGAIAQKFAGMGVPQSLISAALQNGTVGQEAQQGYMNALNARAGAANQGLTALNNQGQLAGQMYGLQANQANTVAAAQNALNQFNAQNTQQANLANQAAKQTANQYNVQNKQGIANQNVLGQQEVQKNNQVIAPQTAAQLALQKAGAAAGIGQAQANQQTQVGQQQAGLYGGLLGAGATLGAAYMQPQMAPIILGGGVQAKAAGGEIVDPNKRMPATPANFVQGGRVPGRPMVPGDSPVNDTVHAKLSPGEFVVPRSDMARPEVRNFLAMNTHTPNPPSAHPSDVASVLRALASLRGEAA